MSNSVTYPLIFLCYFGVLIALLLISVIVQFFRKTRYLGSYFLLSAIFSIPGLIIGLLVCGMYTLLEIEITNHPSFSNWHPLVRLAIIEAPLGITAGFVVLGMAGGAYLVHRSRLRRFGSPSPPENHPPDWSS